MIAATRNMPRRRQTYKEQWQWHAPHADLLWPLPSQHGIRIIALGLLGAQARDEQLRGGWSG